jgi:leucyl aminopeptidase (aminopeptidase T)
MEIAMFSALYWDEVAEVIVRRLVRPEAGDPFLIIVDSSGDLNFAQACLAAGLRAGADAQLIIKSRYVRGTASEPGPILSDAIRASKLVLALCEGIVRAPAMIEARNNGTRLLMSDINGIEDYVVRALLDVDIEAMNRNAELVAKLWDRTRRCRVTSPQGTDLSFELAPRTSVIGDGALSEDGEVDFFPGAQVSIAPVEKTINGTIVVDASDSVQGVVNTDYAFTVENGVIIAVDGGREAGVMRDWLKTCHDETIYKLCHFSIGLNPQAGISGNMLEDERLLAGIDFGFGYQDPAFGGTVGLSPYHMDIMLATPTIYLDGQEMSGGGKLNHELGFEQL